MATISCKLTYLHQLHRKKYCHLDGANQQVQTNFVSQIMLKTSRNYSIDALFLPAKKSLLYSALSMVRIRLLAILIELFCNLRHRYEINDGKEVTNVQVQHCSSHTRQNKYCFTKQITTSVTRRGQIIVQFQAINSNESVPNSIKVSKVGSNFYRLSFVHNLSRSC